ncbi:hypothetical protein [Flavobacterium selenitireducens]|uniref:hypothetical protein n=1 Tax=Flavobacterium selenitireducens TaxID=2722704 RepID=UPI00168BD586|nr:hypothetical protein [Flavobacterium selenitireducens]MBD3582185.1 hypothetical protein [Flavobacterium selenitireducens]
MIRKFVICIIALLNFVSVSGQDEKQFYSADFNWRIDLPHGFYTVSDAESAQQVKRGKEMFEATLGSPIVNQAVPIFSFKKDQFNHMEANFQPFDEATDGPYEDSVEMLQQLLIASFEREIPGKPIKSRIYKETIDGLEFYVSYISLEGLPNNGALHMYMFSRLFGKRDFSVGIVSLIPQTEQTMLEVLRKSTFH